MRRPGPHVISLSATVTKVKTSYVPTLTKSEQTVDPVSTPCFSLPLATGNSWVGAQGLHPTSIPPKVEPQNKNEDPETVHRVAFKRNSCPSIDTGKPDREREPDGRKGKFVLLGSPLTSFDILVEKL